MRLKDRQQLQSELDYAELITQMKCVAIWIKTTHGENSRTNRLVEMAKELERDYKPMDKDTIKKRMARVRA